MERRQTTKKDLTLKELSKRKNLINTDMLYDDDQRERGKGGGGGRRG